MLDKNRFQKFQKKILAAEIKNALSFKIKKYLANCIM